MFCPNKCQLSIILLRTLFYQCVSSRWCSHLNSWLFSPFHVKKGPKVNKNDQGPKDCRLLTRIWPRVKLSEQDVENYCAWPAKCECTWKLCEHGHVYVSLWTFKTDQRGGTGSGHLHAHAYVSVVCVYMGIMGGRDEGQTLQNISNSTVWIRIWCSLSLPDLGSNL